MKDSNSISPFWWLCVPLAIIFGQVVLECVVHDSVRMAQLHSEGGPHETLQSLALAFGLIVALIGAFRIDWAKKKLVGAWFALAAFCIFYVLGEEISWGQHILNWDTPAYWAAVNDQNETNLHNTSAWLDQKPRLILFIGILVGGLIVPALRRWKPSTLPVRFAPLYPANILVVTALGVALPYTAQEIAEHFFDAGLFERVSEVQELYMYYFVSLYLLDLYNREK